MTTSYYRLCKSLNDKGILVPEGFDFEKYKQGEAYISAYKYNEDHYKIFTDKGTVAGISDVKTDTIFFDLDCGGDIEKARQDTITVCQRLSAHSINLDDVRICISGSKGFHVTIHTSRDYNPEEVKSFAINIAGDLDSFDSSVYNANRIMRMEGSIHPKTNLRKTRLSFDELSRMSIVEIKNISKDVYAFEKTKKISLPEELTKVRKVEKKVDSITDNVDYLSNPLNLSPRLLAISQGFFPNGQRSNALLILAANLLKKGMTKEQAYYYCKASIDLQSKRYQGEKFSKEELYKNIIDQVYSDNWKGGTFTENNYSHGLVEYFEDFGVPEKHYQDVVNDVVGITDNFDEFVEYGRNIDKYTMTTGIPSLDKALKIRKGHLIGLIAPPSVGKTSFAIELLKSTSLKGTASYFGCYDMYSSNVVQKLAQKERGYNEEELFNIFKQNDIEKIEDIKQSLKDNYGNVSFCFNSGQSIEQIKKSVELEEIKRGVRIELVVIDYLELVKTDKSDPTMSSAEAAQGLREIANDGRVVLVLLQPNKMSSKVDQPMLSYNAAKGSSSIAQACTAILGCWREGLSPNTPEEDKYFSVNILKNRNGGLASLDFAWDGKTQTISELTREQRFALEVLRDTKKDADKNDNDNGF